MTTAVDLNSGTIIASWISRVGSFSITSNEEITSASVIPVNPESPEVTVPETASDSILSSSVVLLTNLLVKVIPVPSWFQLETNLFNTASSSTAVAVEISIISYGVV